MRSDIVAALLLRARKQLNLSQAELARQVGVSLRLVGELERGQRAQVGLEVALHLLEAAGVSVVFRTPDGMTTTIRPANAEALQRQARAAARRKSWTGGVVPVHTSEAPAAGDSAATRLYALAQVTSVGFGMAAAGTKGRSDVNANRKRADSSTGASRGAKKAHLAARRTSHR